MKNIRQELDDSLRAEYKRSDFGEIILGKFAAKPTEFGELVRLLLACIAEDEAIQSLPRFNPLMKHKEGDWTYEIDDASRITLRYWVSDVNSLTEEVLTSQNLTSPQDRKEFQKLLTKGVRRLKERASEL